MVILIDEYDKPIIEYLGKEELPIAQEISMNPNYATICGYTQIELETYFDTYLDSITQKNQVSKASLL